MNQNINGKEKYVPSPEAAALAARVFNLMEMVHKHGAIPILENGMVGVSFPEKEKQYVQM